jgi:predicted transcriptional regulator
MGSSKTEFFTENQNQVATWLKALAHPARIAIIQHLLKTNSCVGTDLLNELPLAQATISQHLKELKEAGIIKGDVEGTRISYCINTTIWNMMKAELNLLLEGHVPNNNCC